MGMRLKRIALLAVILGAACRADSPPPRNDTAVADVAPPDTMATGAESDRVWTRALGNIFVVPGPDAGTAFVIDPRFTSDSSLDSARFDTQRVLEAEFDLLLAGRVAGHAKPTDVARPRAEECPAWPTVRITGVGADSQPPPVWNVGFISARMAPIALDSTQTLARPDSIRLTVALTRVASTLPGDTATAFQGRPFVVRMVRQFWLDGRQIVVAEIIRLVNQEATPLQEHLIVVAERDSGATTAFEATYFERTIGLEDALETTDLVAVARPLRGGAAVLLILRDFGDGTVYSLLERTGEATAPRWRLQWTSAYAGC